MRAVIRQAKANLGSRKTQSVLIFFTLLVSATLFTVALSTLHVAQGAYDRLFERTHGAHLWLCLKPEEIPAEEADQILTNLSGVEETTGVMHTLSGTLLIDDERLGGVWIREWPDDEVNVNRPLIVAGRAPNKQETEVIVLDRNVAASHDVRVGDRIEILTPQGPQPLTIIGLYVSAEFCPYPMCFPPRNYLARGDLENLGLLTSEGQDEGRFYVGLRLNEPEKLSEILHVAEAGLPGKAINYWESWEELRSFADGSIRNMRILLITFSIVAFLASGFLIANTVNASVRSQTRQIGLLKAIGFTGWQLVAIYLAEYLGLGIIAGLLGLVFGSLTVSFTLRHLAAMFGETLVWPPLWIVLAAPIGTLLLSTVFTLLSVHRVVHMNAVNAIRTNLELPRRRTSRLPNIPLPLSIGISDAISRPFRSILTIFGIAMAVLTLTASMTLNTTFQAFLNDPNLIGFDADLILNRTTYISDAEVRQLIATQPEVMASYIERWENFRFQGEDELLRARFREGDLQDFQFPIVEGRMFERPDEAVVGYGLISERGIKIGDELKISIGGNPFTLKVVGTYREFSNLGRMLLLPFELLRRVEPETEVFTYTLKLVPEADPETVAMAFTSESNHMVEVNIPMTGGLPSDIVLSQKAMAVLSVLMSVIALVGILSSIWLSVKDRQREFGMLKAVGMTPLQIVLSVLTAAVLLALFGYAIGIPIGLSGIRLLIDFVARVTGFGPLSAPTDELGLLLLLPGCVIIAILGAWIPARQAGRVRVVEMLRYE
jgi:putative ABC transport system permease protein